MKCVYQTIPHIHCVLVKYFFTEKQRRTIIFSLLFIQSLRYFSISGRLFPSVSIVLTDELFNFTVCALQEVSAWKKLQRNSWCCSERATRTNDRFYAIEEHHTKWHRNVMIRGYNGGMGPTRCQKQKISSYVINHRITNSINSETLFYVK